MSFPTAAQARVQATDSTIVLDEIHAIETAVLLAVREGQLLVSNAGGNTVMTSTESGDNLNTAQLYFNVWKGNLADDSKSAYMQSVIDYFSQLGYGIKRVTNTSTGTTFLWYVTW